MPSPRAAAAFLFACVAALPAVAQDRPETLAPGATAPDFVAIDRAGNELRLSDFAGKVVVLDYWATWCGPCIASLPHVQEVAKARAADDVVVLAVCTSDTRKRFEAWIDEHAADYPDVRFACDPFDRGSDRFDERASSRLYHVTGLPTKFVVGRDGKIALTIVGHEDGDVRLEAGLARAGVSIDPAVAKTGEAQVAAAAREAAVRAAEASARPIKLFFPEFGMLKAKAAMTGFEFVDEGGETRTLAAFHGKPVVLALSWGAGAPPAKLQELHEKFGAYGVQTLSCFVGTPRDEFDAAVAARGGERGYRCVWDPAGKLEAKGAEPTPEERMAFHGTTVIGKLFGTGMYPAMPILLVVDGDGRFVGGLQLHPRWLDGVANLLLHAGVELAPADMPSEVVAADAFEPAPPRQPEAAVAPIAVGTEAPDFTMQDLEGGPVQLSDYRGKVVVLDFWATWCGPCKAAMPHVQDVAKRYAEQGVVVVASCTSDGRQAFESWVRENGAKYPDVVFAHDAAERAPERASRRLFGVSGIPAQFVIDREGRIVATVSGYREGEVLLDAALSKAGITVDVAILEKAVEDQKRRDAQKSAPMVPAIPLAPIRR